ncbi:shikimate kinase [Nitrosopumilus sp. K4]|uniref:shikimate kinase n=1 Tax=Nitrosopumilus sp. K4 TaxID=2795383 RepID=UPI001BADCF63|nr:shikimate kinase [Nitrosopumilus sp. K4]QUC63937.1 shikimate kinase [Nitrosopumilus sp. K4]
MAKAVAVVHGAISVVNAIANQKGATLGIELQVEAIVETKTGKGISIQSKNKSLSSRLVNKTVEKIVPKKDLEKNNIAITLNSEIPLGYGLKSSSAISSAVALACAKIFKPKASDQQILLAGVDASIETKVSMTGAYDDACSCYFGGFNVTNNEKKQRTHYEKIPPNLSAVIFLPKSRKRGNLKNLKVLSSVFDNAWELARKSKYWDAMTINGLATSVLLNSDPTIITNLIEKGALAASVSGNGPSIAAITKKEDEANVKKVFSGLEGTTIVSKVNNKKAEVHEV